MNNKKLLTNSVVESPTLIIVNNDYIDAGFVYVYLKDGTMDIVQVEERKFLYKDLNLNRSISAYIRPGWCVEGNNITTADKGLDINHSHTIYDIEINDVSIDATINIVVNRAPK